MPKKDVKLSQNVNSNGKRKKKKNKRPISKFMTIFMIVSLALLIFQIIKLNLLPTKLHIGFSCFDSFSFNYIVNTTF